MLIVFGDLLSAERVSWLRHFCDKAPLTSYRKQKLSRVWRWGAITPVRPALFLSCLDTDVQTFRPVCARPLKQEEEACREAQQGLLQPQHLPQGAALFQGRGPALAGTTARARCSLLHPFLLLALECMEVISWA